MFAKAVAIHGRLIRDKPCARTRREMCRTSSLGSSAVSRRSSSSRFCSASTSDMAANDQGFSLNSVSKLRSFARVVELTRLGLAAVKLQK
jgi:hypothetical protein